MKEKSCGAIIYRKKSNKLEFLIVKQSNENYSFPKGHIEANETEIETVLREVKEETNLDIKLDTNFRESITYFLESKKRYKEAVYFIGYDYSGNLKSQEGEILNCDWYEYKKALELLEFDNIRGVLKKAFDYINSKK